MKPKELLDVQFAFRNSQVKYDCRIADLKKQKKPILLDILRTD